MRDVGEQELRDKIAAADTEIDRLRGVLGMAVHRLSRAADAVADVDLSDPRIDHLSGFAIEIEGMLMPEKKAQDFVRTGK